MVFLCKHPKYKVGSSYRDGFSLGRGCSFNITSALGPKDTAFSVDDIGIGDSRPLIFLQGLFKAYSISLVPNGNWRLDIKREL